MKQSPRLPLWQSIFWIVGSALFVSGTAHKVLQNSWGKKEKNQEKVKEMVSFIVQTGLQKEALHSDYLAELLDLSQDRPTLFQEFNEGEAQKKLLSSPLFQEARVRKISPNMVYIDYTVRKPFGWSTDFVNVALDREGYLFPMSPFFSPKKLPEVYLGKEAISGIYGETQPSFELPLKGKFVDVAFRVLECFKGCEKDFFRVKRVDVSQSFFPTLGKRGITVMVENEYPNFVFSTHFLRLSTASFSKEIANYLNLRPHLIELEEQKIQKGEKLPDKVIDLRLSQLAFID